MRSHPSTRSRCSIAGSLLVLLVVLGVVVVVAAQGPALMLPRLRHGSALVLLRLRHGLQGTLHGDARTAGGPVVCRAGDVLASAHKGDHLILQQRCVTAFGRVALILHAHDGDTHISVLPDRGYWPLLDTHNLALQGGTLVVEVAPADRAGVTIPTLGAHVRVTGAYVTDRVHGWRELHPTWQIVRVS